jgi:hypothetical protein
MTLPPGDTDRPAAPVHPPVAQTPVAPVFDFGLGDGSQYAASQQQAEASGLRPRSREQQRRRAAVDHRSFVVPLVISLVAVLVVAGSVFTGWTLVQQSEAEVKADSAAFCANLAETPGVLTQPAFGWPTEGADLQSTLDLMKEYQARWEAIAAIAPPTIKPDTRAVADAAAAVVDGIVASKSIDRQASLAAMQRVTSATDISAWAGKYC